MRCKQTGSAGAGHLVDAGFDISGINQTAVDINASGFTNFLTGVRVTGGPVTYNS